MRGMTEALLDDRQRDSSQYQLVDAGPREAALIHFSIPPWLSKWTPTRDG